jgi:hypothetical protein
MLARIATWRGWFILIRGYQTKTHAYSEMLGRVVFSTGGNRENGGAVRRGAAQHSSSLSDGFEE